MQEAPVVILTRETGDNREAVERLRSLSIPVKEYPCIRTTLLPYRSGEPVRGVPLEDYHIIVFTSKRGVAGMREAAPLLSESKQFIAVVGNTTAAAAAGIFGRKPCIVAKPPTGEALARQLVSRFPNNLRVLHPRGNKTTGTFKTIMESHGFALTELEVYRNDMPEIQPLPEKNLENAIVVFASPSAAKCFFKTNTRTASGTVYLSIGPVTAKYLDKIGRGPVITALEPGVDALVNEIIELQTQFSAKLGPVSQNQ